VKIMVKGLSPSLERRTHAGADPCHNAGAWPTDPPEHALVSAVQDRPVGNCRAHVARRQNRLSADFVPYMF
jgi:hypothetical protein